MKPLERPGVQILRLPEGSPMDGIEIVKAEIMADNELVLTFSDDTTAAFTALELYALAERNDSFILLGSIQ